MASGVVSIHVEAAGVSITLRLADGRVAVEEPGGLLPRRPPRRIPPGRFPVVDAKLPAPGLNGAGRPAPAKPDAVPARVAETVSPSPAVAAGPAPLPASAPDLVPPPAKPPPDPANGHARPWSADELGQLKAMWPTHPARAVAKKLGRGFEAVRAKARQLGLKKVAPVAAAKPKSLSAAAAGQVRAQKVQSPAVVTAAPKPPAGTVSKPPASASGRADRHAVPLVEHRTGQCRWVVDDGPPAMYCGRPVVGSTSWCAEHSRRAARHSVPPRSVHAAGMAAAK